MRLTSSITPQTLKVREQTTQLSRHNSSSHGISIRPPMTLQRVQYVHQLVSSLSLSSRHQQISETSTKKVKEVKTHRVFGGERIVHFSETNINHFVDCFGDGS